MLENIHLEASVAVCDDMLEYIKVHGYRQAHDRAGTSPKGFQLWVNHVGAGLFLKGLQPMYKATLEQDAPQSDCGYG